MQFRTERFALTLAAAGSVALISQLLNVQNISAEIAQEPSKEKSDTAVTFPTADVKLSEQAASSLAEKIDKRVSTVFYNAVQVEQVWKPQFESARESLRSAGSLFEFSKRINAVLANLKASHTQFVSANDEAFFFMRSLFGSSNNQGSQARKAHRFDADFTGLGVGGAHAEQNQVRYVLEGSPSYAAGFRRGDKIISAGDRKYTGYDVWYHTSGKAVPVTVKRGEQTLKLEITPKKKDFLEGYQDASEKSAKVVTQGKHKIGYYHFWCGGEDMHDLLQDALSGSLKDSEALVLDLRDGYGAASFEDIDFFLRPKLAYPDMKSVSRKETHSTRMYYDKPIAILINKGTRSGKELMAFGLKRVKRGKLYGDTTAGYVLGGRLTVLDERSALYVAAVDVFLDGERIEGKGVEPDVPVKDVLAEKDVVMETALENLAKELGN